MSPPTQTKRAAQAKDRAKSKAKGKAKASTNSKASANPFGRLPDEVLLQILKNGCDRQAQQAAYKSCKDIRDFCDRYMKSVVIKIYSADSLKAVRQASSITMCPKAARGIESRTVYILHMFEDNSMDSAYHYFNKLISNSFNSPGTHRQCRKEQLAKVSTLKLLQPGIDALAAHHMDTISRLLTHLQHLQTLHTDITSPAMVFSIQSLRHAVFKRPLPMNDLNAFSFRHPMVETLGIVAPTQAWSQYRRPQPLQFKNLKHLYVTSPVYGWVTASVFTGLRQLTTLSVQGVYIDDLHLLRQLCITSLTLEDVRNCCLDQPEEQYMPVQWPALRCVHFKTSGQRDIVIITETSARALLPLPHRDFKVVWPTCTHYTADGSPLSDHDYIFLAHLESCSSLSLCGQYVKPALKVIVKNRLIIHELSVWDEALEMTADDVATYLDIPTVVSMHLRSLVHGSPQLFSEIFMHCTMLKTLFVPLSCMPQHAEQAHCLRLSGLTCTSVGNTLCLNRYTRRSSYCRPV